MLCGCTPFQADTDEATRQRILSGAVTFPDHLSSPARALISGMLQVLSSSADESLNTKTDVNGGLLRVRHSLFGWEQCRSTRPCGSI